MIRDQKRPMPPWRWTATAGGTGPARVDDGAGRHAVKVGPPGHATRAADAAPLTARLLDAYSPRSSGPGGTGRDQVCVSQAGLVPPLT